MALWIQEGQRVRVSKIAEMKDKYAVLHLSSSRKNEDGVWIYSDWGFVRFVGKAFQYLENVKEKDILTLKKSYWTKESFEKDGEMTRPKNPQMVVFDCELYVSASGTSAKVEPPPEDDIPF